MSARTEEAAFRPIEAAGEVTSWVVGIVRLCHANSPAGTASVPDAANIAARVAGSSKDCFGSVLSSLSPAQSTKVCFSPSIAAKRPDRYRPFLPVELEGRHRILTATNLRGIRCRGASSGFCPIAVWRRVLEGRREAGCRPSDGKIKGARCAPVGELKKPGISVSWARFPGLQSGRTW
jgi:hypothetical protein